MKHEKEKSKSSSFDVFEQNKIVEGNLQEHRGQRTGWLRNSYNKKLRILFKFVF